MKAPFYKGAFYWADEDICLSQKFCNRLSKFLSNNNEEQDYIKNLADNIYDIRCTIAHGKKESPTIFDNISRWPGKRNLSYSQMREYVRRLILIQLFALKILSDDKNRFSKFIINENNNIPNTHLEFIKLAHYNIDNNAFWDLFYEEIDIYISKIDDDLPSLFYRISKLDWGSGLSAAK
ncbi:MAG: hypothetical protein JXA92_11650 [candidate division Zixibacteria bacterium]|nr:hypothetical protein [candidate division Zixibacteria bacterium]